MRIIAVLLGICALFNLSEVQSQVISYRMDTIYCLASDKIENTYVASRLASRSTRGAKEQVTDIQVTYNGFTEEAKVAFQYAVDIWARIIKSPVTIRISANWEGLSEGTLGSAIYGSVRTNLEGMQPNTWYPVALAEKIARREINNINEADIVARFNRDFNWYLGTDGKPTGDQYDLVTVVLHEIGHGLGIIDSFNANDDIATWGAGGTANPIIFDRYVTNEPGQTVLSRFQRNTTALRQELTSNSIYFTSIIAADSNNKVSPRLFAPKEWSGGSSIAHLNESTYFSGNKNSLMTPQIGRAEAIHDPGPIVLGMFVEMGWWNITIDHIPVTLWEDVDIFPEITTKIYDEVPMVEGSLKVVYSNDNFATTKEAIMTKAEGNNWSATLDIGKEMPVKYYITAEDISGRQFRHPSTSSSTHEFLIIEDKEVPEIDHIAIDNTVLSANLQIVDALVTDLAGVSDVLLHYSADNQNFTTVPMVLSPLRENFYTYSLKPSTLGVSQGDLIYYYITAIDQSRAKNEGRLPAVGAFEMQIASYFEVKESYFTNFESVTNDFYLYAMEIDSPPGFESMGLHSEHPYRKGRDQSYESNYIAVLRHPIKIAAGNAIMTFDEIVMVEPSESGATFGSSSFYDYVIVEGSKTGGRFWSKIVDGYDSRSISDWLTNYNSEKVDDNSLFQPDPSLYRKRTIDLKATGSFKSGDEIIIRFRLYSDQLAYGWGWAIDNLNIQGVITGIDEEDLTGLSVYPNPVNDRMRLDWGAAGGGGAQVTILDLTGRTMFEGNFSDSDGYAEIATELWPDAVYVALVNIGGRVLRTRLIKQ